MKYLFATIFCWMLASCGGGSSGSPAASSTLPVSYTAGLLSPDCTGASCGAVNANTYSGTGIGIWRYDNTSGAASTIDISIAGVTAGKSATLVFSNGSEAAATLPVPGVLASSVTSSPALADLAGVASAVSAHQGQDDAHARMLEKNRVVSAGLMHARSTAKTAADLMDMKAAATARLSFSPAVGTSRSWIDNFPATPVAYTASVQLVCPLPSGRNVVWWVDPAIVSSGQFTAAAWSAALGRMQASYCGGAGGLAQLNTLLGDVWGSAASGYASLIQDAPALQDVNVVLLNAPASSQWAGYFFGGDTQLKAAFPSSNQALAFFINAGQVKFDLNFAISTLLHESTHMVNFYQRAVARHVIHDTWLEETTAMMTEDIVVPAVLGGYNKVTSGRLPGYLNTGGDVSYIDWPALADSSPNYAIGGGFGAFLDRRYGLSIYQQLLTSCSDGISATPALTSYGCLDALIKANGGAGFSDEFARFGATVFGQLPGVGTPAGYGYPATAAGAYTLQAADLSRSAMASPAPLAAGYRATSHTFQRDILATGKTSYVRSGVVVPANTTLMVLIQ